MQRGVERACDELDVDAGNGRVPVSVLDGVVGSEGTRFVQDAANRRRALGRRDSREAGRCGRTRDPAAVYEHRGAVIERERGEHVEA